MERAPPRLFIRCRAVVHRAEPCGDVRIIRVSVCPHGCHFCLRGTVQALHEHRTIRQCKRSVSGCILTERPKPRTHPRIGTCALIEMPLCRRCVPRGKRLCLCALRSNPCRIEIHQSMQ